MDATPSLSELLLKPAPLLIMVGCWILLDLVYRLLPDQIRDSKAAVRLAPFYPLVVCQIAVWLPGIYLGLGHTERALTGLLLGWASAHIFKIVTQTVLGKDHRIQGFEDACEVCEARQQLDPVDQMKARQSQIPTKDLKPNEVPTASDIVAGRLTPPPEAK